MPLTKDPTRAVLQVAGADAKTFLQGLLTNDVGRAAADQAVYAALLTPQGKFLFDAILTSPAPETFWLDVPADQADALMKRLTMYKLRAKATLERLDDLEVALIWGDADAPEAARAVYDDPRAAALGRRAVLPAGAVPEDPDVLSAHEALRIAAIIPAAGAELLKEETYPLEAGFERAHGVDFKKGCFVGQEIVARMKHKSELRRRLCRVALEGAAPPPGAEILAGDKPAGVMGASLDGEGLAVLRMDRVEGASLRAGETCLRLLEADQRA